MFLQNFTKLVATTLLFFLNDFSVIPKQKHNKSQNRHDKNRRLEITLYGFTEKHQPQRHDKKAHAPSDNARRRKRSQIHIKYAARNRKNLIRNRRKRRKKHRRRTVFVIKRFNFFKLRMIISEKEIKNRSTAEITDKIPDYSAQSRRQSTQSRKINGFLRFGKCHHAKQYIRRGNQKKAFYKRIPKQSRRTRSPEKFTYCRKYIMHFMPLYSLNFRSPPDSPSVAPLPRCPVATSRFETSPTGNAPKKIIE